MLEIDLTLINKHAPVLKGLSCAPIVLAASTSTAVGSPIPPYNSTGDERRDHNFAKVHRQHYTEPRNADAPTNIHHLICFFRLLSHFLEAHQRDTNLYIALYTTRI
jgi:hypothetical protein